MITARCTQPLQKMPAADLSFGVRLHRRTSAAAMHDPQAMLAANQKLVTRLLALGGKVYPPYAPVLTQEQWRQHYGSTIWQRFAAAKKRFDRTTCSRRARGFSKLRLKVLLGLTAKVHAPADILRQKGSPIRPDFRRTSWSRRCPTGRAIVQPCV